MIQNFKKYFLLAFLFFCCQITFSQEARRQSIDSLLQQLPSIEEDSSGTVVLRRLGSFYLRVDLDSAFMYLNKGLVVAEKINLTSEELHINQSLAAAYVFVGNLDKAINSYEKGFEAALIYGDTVRSMLILTELVIAAREKGDSKITNRFFEKGYNIASGMLEYGEYFAARLDINKGSIFSDLSEYDSAFYYWKRARESMVRLKLPGFTAVVNNNMAAGYYNTYDYPNALSSYKEALEIATSIDYRPVELDAVIGIARVYSAIDNADLAIEKLTPVYEEEKKVGNSARVLKVEKELIKAYYQKKDSAATLNMALLAYERGRALGIKAANNADITHFLAKLWFEKDEFDSSLYYLKLSDSLAESNSRNAVKFSNLILRAKHKNLSGNHTDAFPFLVKADSIAENILGPNQRAEVSYMNYLYYREIGDLSQALQALEKSNSLKDSLKNLEKRGDLIKLGSAIETAEKQAQIEKRQNEIDTLSVEIEIRKKQNKKVILSIVALLLVVSTFIIWRMKKLKETRVIQTLESEKLQNELTHKKRQLTSNALQEAHKNQLLESLLTETKSIQDKKNTDLSKLIRLVKEGLNSDKKMELFTLQFEESHPDFSKNLRKNHPDLSPREQQVCALVNLNFSTKEIAKFLGIEVGSATTARYRLRQKLNLSKEQNLAKYLQSLHNT